MPEAAAPRELDPHAAESDPTWAACLGGVGSRTLLAFDYDGALAPLATNIRNAPMSEATQAAVQRLLGIAGGRVAIVSARESADVRARFAPLAPLAPAFVVGNHGADGLDPETVRPRLDAWRKLLQAAVDQVPGAELETKSLGYSLHWRQSPDRALAARVLGGAAHSLPDARVIAGNTVLHVLPIEARHKGQALEQLVADGGFDHVLFVGAEAAAEPAYSHRYSVPFTGIHVGASGALRAAFFLREPGLVDTLIVRLTQLLQELAPADSIARP